MITSYKDGIFFLTSLLSLIHVYNGNWVYKKGDIKIPGPSNWSNLKMTYCQGYNQSPISIWINETRPGNERLLPFTFVDTNAPKRKMILTKVPHTIQLNFTERWHLKFGNKGCLRPVEIHWHWGSTDELGSEHMIGGKVFPMEGQIVAYNCAKYKTLEIAKKNVRGVHVLAIMYEIGSSNKEIGELLKSFKEVNAGKAVWLNEKNPKDFLPNDLTYYLRYEGSLTVPPCEEPVIWNIFLEPVRISQEQLQQLRNFDFMKPETGKMVDNFRPLIEANHSRQYLRRYVYISFSESIKVSKIIDFFMIISFLGIYL